MHASTIRGAKFFIEFDLPNIPCLLSNNRQNFPSQPSETGRKLGGAKAVVCHMMKRPSLSSLPGAGSRDLRAPAQSVLLR